MDLGGERVLLVNDVITTGQGLLALRAVVDAVGGFVVGAACFADRSTSGDVATRLGAPVCFSVAINLPAVRADECELCRRGGIELEDALDIN